MGVSHIVDKNMKKGVYSGRMGRSQGGSHI